MSELTPYICVTDARTAIEWYVEVLGAEVVIDPIIMDDGHVGHVELAVDGARWMMREAFEAAGVAVEASGTAMVRGPSARAPAARPAKVSGGTLAA